MGLQLWVGVAILTELQQSDAGVVCALLANESGMCYSLKVAKEK